MPQLLSYLCGNTEEVKIRINTQEIMMAKKRQEPFTAIPHVIYEAIIRTNLSDYESRILHAVIRKTKGWNKKIDRISYSQLKKMTGIRHKQSIARTVKKLWKRKILIRENLGGFKGFNMGLQEDYNIWGSKADYSNLDSLQSSDEFAVINRVSMESSRELTDKSAAELTKESVQQLTTKEIKENLKKETKENGLSSPFSAERGNNKEEEQVSNDGNKTPISIQEEPKKQVPTTAEEVRTVLEDWNAMAAGCNCRGVLNTELSSEHKRYQKIAKLMKDEFFRLNYRKAINKVKNSSFCNGENDRSWTADIDFFLRDDRIEQILEGKYDGAEEKEWHFR